MVYHNPKKCQWPGLSHFSFPVCLQLAEWKQTHGFGTQLAEAKWRTLQRDERVEPRSLIKSNWETNIRSRVYSPEKINQEPWQGCTGGLWEKGWEVHEVRGRPGLEDTEPYYSFTLGVRGRSARASARTALGLRGSCHEWEKRPLPYVTRTVSVHLPMIRLLQPIKKYGYLDSMCPFNFQASFSFYAPSFPRCYHNTLPVLTSEHFWIFSI